MASKLLTCGTGNWKSAFSYNSKRLSNRPNVHQEGTGSRSSAAGTPSSTVLQAPTGKDLQGIRRGKRRV